MSDAKFDLTWNDFSRNSEKTIRNLANDTLFTDVTLLSDDCKRIKAHKVILSSSSDFFRDVLSETSAGEPLLFLKGIQHSELQAIIKFMYIGTIEIAQEDFKKFLKAATDLQIEGLQEFKNVDDSIDKSYSYQHTKKDQIREQFKESKIYIEYSVSNFDEPDNKSQFFELALDQESDHSSIMTNFKIGNFEKNADGSHSCDECEYKTKYSGHLKKHKLGKHLGVKFKCDQCENEFSTRSNVRKHTKSKHEGYC